MNAIGQAVLAVPARSLKVAQRGKERVRIDHVSADISFPNFAHVGRRLILLDDFQNLAGRAADDSATRKRPVQHGGQQRQVRALQPMAVHQAANRIRAKQGCVAVEDEQIAVEVFKQRRHLEDRMRRPEKFVLNGISIARAQMQADFLLAVTDHHINALRRHDPQRVPHYALEHTPLTQRLKDQGTAVRRPGVLAGGEHDRSQAHPGWL